MYKPQYPGLYYFDTFTFTTLGTSGSRGPDSTKTYANAPWRDGDFYIQDGQQHWTVPANGTYQITAAGAYGATPGRVVTGQVELNEGQTLTMLVGQRPTSTYAGGGTFVTSGGVPLIIASGGDGTGGHAASFSPYGTGQGLNGAGYLTDGLQTDSSYKFIEPKAYVNGGFGNRLIDNSAQAGFGGGNLVGAGGYTGSPGNGVSGATCYADASVQNFTDLGVSSNTSGIVTVSLINPTSVTETWSWDSTQQWSLNNQSQIGTAISNPLWSGKSFIVTDIGTQQSLTSLDGISWSRISSNLKVSVCSNSGIFLSIQTDKIYRSTDTVSWTITNTGSFSDVSFFLNNLFIVQSADLSKLYTSPDGITWTTITPNVTSLGSGVIGGGWLTYGKSKYIAIAQPSNYYFPLYTSTNLTTWTLINDSNVSSNPYGWVNVNYEPQNQKFVALRWYNSGTSPLLTQFVANNMTPQPTANNPSYNITSITYTGIWINGTAAIGNVMYFADISGPVMYFNPATYGTITATTSSSVTISLVSSTITVPKDTQYYNALLTFISPSQNRNIIINSSDGITWYGQSTPLSSYLNWSKTIVGGGKIIGLNPFTGLQMMYSLDGGSNWNLTAGTLGPTNGVYSPELGYFMFIDNSIAYLSFDGKYITSAVQNIIYGDIVSYVWADTLGLLVAITNSPSIIFSSDGKNWDTALNILTDGSRNGTGSILWSKEKGTLIAYIYYYSSIKPNKYLVYTSNDGINWSLYYTSESQGFLPSAWSWSYQLGLFTTGSQVSQDGLNWTIGSGPSLQCVVWSPNLKLFVGSDSSTTYYSKNGLTWTTSSGTPSFDYITWSPTLKIFVSTRTYTYYTDKLHIYFYIYTSSDGITWNKVYTGNDGEYGNGLLTWSPELNLFVHMIYVQTSGFGTTLNIFYIMTSRDGTNWTKNNTSILSSANLNSQTPLIWISNLKSFFTASYRSNISSKTF